MVYGVSKIGVVEDVEKIRSRLKRKPLPEFELPPQRQIDLRGAESAQGITSQISLHRPGGYRECRWINRAARLYQISFNASWICRDVVDVDANRPAVATGANVWVKSWAEVLDGTEKFEWFSALNNSTRNWTFNFSL